jgi:cytochrome b involved in lipid metabolism
MEKTKYTREQIAERIIEHGDLLVIHTNKIYRLNAWIKNHPGGEMVILHMVGKVRENIFARTNPTDLF